MILLLLVFATITFAGQVETTAELQAVCLAQNPPGRMVWDFSVGPPGENMSQGGSVQSNYIASDLAGYCVQVDCVQNTFVANDAFQYCTNGEALWKKYDVTFDFPACKPIYTEQTYLKDDLICAKCPSAILSSAYSFNSCQNGLQVLSRPITTFYDSSCTERSAVEYQFTGQPCFDWFGPVGLLTVLAVLVIGFKYRKRLGFK